MPAHLFFSIEPAGLIMRPFRHSPHHRTEVVVDVVVTYRQISDEVKQLFPSHHRHAVPSTEVVVHVDAVLS